jgi:DNA-binding response OmpR family regulator
MSGVKKASVSTRSPSSTRPAVTAADERRQRDRRQRDRRRDAAARTRLSDASVMHIGDIDLDHVHMTISGPRDSRRLTSSQYRTLMSLLARPDWRAMADEIASDALDMRDFSDPTAMRKSIQRLNRRLRTVSGTVRIRWRARVVALIVA